MAGLLLIELRALGWRQSAFRKILSFNKKTNNDFALTLLNLLGFTEILVLFMTFGGSNYIPLFLEKLIGTTLISQISNQLLQILIYLIVIDFVEYWYHRILHKISFLWEAHKFHHSMEEFIVFSRQHPIESLFRMLIYALPLSLLGAPIESFILITILLRIIDYLQHSMFEWDYGWIGRWVIYSPIHHRVHHSKEEEHWDKNFGNIFVIWDRIFGTWYNGGRVNTTVGVANNIYNKHNLIWDLSASTLLTAKKLISSIRTGKWTI